MNSYDLIHRHYPNVSRETFDQLEQFVLKLDKWNKTINLIRYHDINELWQRHILDALQLSTLLPESVQIITDFGSGGGIPAIPLAIIKPYTIHLIESDTRKCAFLNECRSLAQGTIIVHNDRIESLIPWKSDVITARAFAPLYRILDIGERFIEKSNFCLLHKGKNSVKEIEEAEKKWTMDIQLHPSIIEENSAIIQLDRVTKVGNE